MAKFSISLLLFLFLGSAYCGVPDSCPMLAFMECWNPSTESAFFNLEGNFPNEAFLKENCEPVTEQLDCLLEHEKTCPISDLLSKETGERFRGLLSLKQLADDMCDEESSLRKDYIQSIGCLDEHMDDHRKDLGEMEYMIDQFNYMQREDNSVAYEILQCVRFAFVFNEIKNSIEKHCGPVASNVFVTIANYVATIEPDQCSEVEENFGHLTELLESFRPSDENIYFNSIE